MRRVCFCWGLVLLLTSALVAQKREKDPTEVFRAPCCTGSTST